jgi:dTDP-D-glucose 4,6-dehydratase
MSLLQTCRYKLPYEKAERLLGYQPSVSFEDGIRRTIGWMEFAGYPVCPRAHAHVAPGKNAEARVMSRD